MTSQDFFPGSSRHIGRLYERAILPTLEVLPMEAQRPFPENADDQSLDWLQVHMSNRRATHGAICPRLSSAR